MPASLWRGFWPGRVAQGCKRWGKARVDTSKERRAKVSADRFRVHEAFRLERGAHDSFQTASNSERIFGSEVPHHQTRTARIDHDLTGGLTSLVRGGRRPMKNREIGLLREYVGRSRRGKMTTTSNLLSKKNSKKSPFPPRKQKRRIFKTRTGVDHEFSGPASPGVS